MEDFYPHTKKSTNFTLRIFGLKYRMKNKIIKGISLRKNCWEKEITVQNRFKFLKRQALQHNHSFWYQKMEWPKVDFIVPSWKCSCICPLVFISSCKYGGNIPFLLVHSSKICVYFKLIFGLHAVLLDRQDIAFSIIKALRNIHYC